MAVSWRLCTAPYGDRSPARPQDGLRPPYGATHRCQDTATPADLDALPGCAWGETPKQSSPCVHQQRGVRVRSPQPPAATTGSLAPTNNNTQAHRHTVTQAQHLSPFLPRAHPAACLLCALRQYPPHTPHYKCLPIQDTQPQSPLSPTCTPVPLPHLYPHSHCVLLVDPLEGNPKCDNAHTPTVPPPRHRPHTSPSPTRVTSP